MPEDTEDDEEDDDDSTAATSDKKKLLVRDFLGDKYDWQLTEFVGPEIPRDKAERRQIYVPSNNHVDIAKKLEEGQVPRFPEEEGMYIGERPKVKKANQNKLENRILREQSEGANGKRNCWFGEDGRLVALPNPIQRMSTRPMSSESSQEPLTVYCYPTMSMTDKTVSGGIPVDVSAGPMRWSGGSAPHCQLDIDLGSVVFNHHHLFSLEHHLVTKIIDIYNNYQTVRSIQSSKGLDQRLNVLYKSLEELKLKMDKWSDEERGFQEQRLRSYTEELRLLREERDDESLKEKELMRAILNLWRILKDVRHKQGYSNTNHKIVAHKEHLDKQAEKEIWDRELRRELEDAKECYNIQRLELIKTFEKELQDWKDINGEC